MHRPRPRFYNFILESLWTYEAAAINEISHSKLTAALAARRRGTHEKFTAAVDKGTVLTNDETRVAFRYHFSLQLMEKLPAKCLCGHKVGDGSHLICKKIIAGQIAAHDDAVRMIGVELNSYGVVVRYKHKQRTALDRERERKRYISRETGKPPLARHPALCAV